MEEIPQGVFKPRMTAQESKADGITRVVRQMLTAEVAAREAKTAKLRAARLAREAAQEVEAPPAKPKRKSSKN